MEFVTTPSQTAGPFFHLGCTDTRSVSCLASPTAKGERIHLVCRVFDGDGLSMNDAMIEIWQADAQGKYNHDWQDIPADANCSGFGRLATDENGTCIFETIKPGRVPGNDGTLQAPHINVSIFARGVLKRLATRIYFAEDSANVQDGVLLLVPKDRRDTLMAQQDPDVRSRWLFDIRLCGEKETVFFDV